MPVFSLFLWVQYLTYYYQWFRVFPSVESFGFVGLQILKGTKTWNETIAAKKLEEYTNDCYTFKVRNKISKTLKKVAKSVRKDKEISKSLKKLENA